MCFFRTILIWEGGASRMGATARSWTIRGFYHSAGPLVQFETLWAVHPNQEGEVLEFSGAVLFHGRTPWCVSRVMKAWRVQQCMVGQPVLRPVQGRECKLRKIAWLWPFCLVGAFSTLRYISCARLQELFATDSLGWPASATILKMQQNKHLCAGHMSWPCHICLDKVAFSSKHYLELRPLTLYKYFSWHKTHWGHILTCKTMEERDVPGKMLCEGTWDFLPIKYTYKSPGLLENLNHVYVSRMTRMSVFILSQSVSNRSISSM